VNKLCSFELSIDQKILEKTTTKSKDYNNVL